MDQITSYATLQSAVAGMLHRASDANITANLPLFIQLCEADLYDRLLLSNMESDETVALTAGNNYVAIPVGFISPIAFWLVIDSVRLELMPTLPQNLPYDPSNSIPKEWAVDGANIRFDCPAADNYDARFRMLKSSNLSVSNTSNALLLRRPDVYLYGTLKQACMFTEDDANVAKWTTIKETAIRGLKAADSRARSIAPLRTELAAHRSNILIG